MDRAGQLRVGRKEEVCNEGLVDVRPAHFGTGFANMENLQISNENA